MSTADSPALSLADLETNDPYARPGGRERRFLCPFPLCGGDKRPNANHRSLSLQTETGLWKCHRCNASGILSENRTHPHSTRQNRGERTRQVLQRATRLPVQAVDLAGIVKGSGKSVTIGDKRFPILRHNSEVERYLEGRGIPKAVADAAGVRFCPDWYGWAAAVFPLRDGGGRLVAAQGRRIDGREGAKAMSAGSVGRGVFATPGAWDAATVVLTEAPLDALSLAVCGIPALALCGKDVRAWMLPRLAFRCVALGLDADEAGDAGAHDWEKSLCAFGARTGRLRPLNGKDWNEVLQRDGPEGLTGLLTDMLKAALPPVERSDMTMFEQACLLFAPIEEISNDCLETDEDTETAR